MPHLPYFLSGQRCAETCLKCHARRMKREAPKCHHAGDACCLLSQFLPWSQCRRNGVMGTSECGGCGCRHMMRSWRPTLRRCNRLLPGERDEGGWPESQWSPAGEGAFLRRSTKMRACGSRFCLRHGNHVGVVACTDRIDERGWIWPSGHPCSAGLCACLSRVAIFVCRSIPIRCGLSLRVVLID